MKLCKGCDDWHPLDDFYVDLCCKDGRRNRCKTCFGKKAAAYRRKNLKRVQAQGRRNSKKFHTKQLRLKKLKRIKTDETN